MASENDLIRRGDVLELLYYFKEHRECPINYGTLLTLISKTWEAPTADVVEVVHGEWIEDRMDYVCSHCKIHFSDELAYIKHHYEGLPRYCPDCGALMDGGNDNA